MLLFYVSVCVCAIMQSALIEMGWNSQIIKKMVELS